MKRIVVYGLGSLGMSIAKELKKREERKQFHIVAFMDKQEFKDQDEFEIVKPDALRELQYDNIVVTSEKWFKEIVEELHSKYGVGSEKVMHLNELIEEGEHFCNLCETTVPFMLDTGIESPVFIKRNIVGGGKREKCVCPLCGSLDRERWLQHILENKIKLYNQEAVVLHFAPERQIEAKLRKNQRLTYITADIEEGRADRIEDITKINFPDRFFDYIICNHVLEHIEDEKSAFDELKRCIKVGGKIIFSVPICWDIDTLEDASVVSEEDRLREYGQKDHVRLYGKDIKTRLETYGFSVQSMNVSDILSSAQIESMRLIPQDTIWLLTL